MTLGRRVRALEREACGDRCTTCGFLPDEKGRLAISYPSKPVEGPDECPECGRVLVVRIVYRPVPPLSADG